MIHPFPFKEATWLGQGFLTYTLVAEILPFNTRWEVKELSPGIYQAKHTVEIFGADEPHQNIYTFFAVDDVSFKVLLQNPIVEAMEGLGFIEETQIGWRIKGPHFEGYELFTQVDDGTYLNKGEFFSQDVSSTLSAKIWKKFT